MRKIPKLILLTLTLCVLFISTPSRTQAVKCSCGLKPLNDEIYALSKMYIAGEIIETRKDHVFHPKYENLSLKIKVDRVWKEKTERIIWLPRIVATDLCGELEIVIGKKYLFRVVKADNVAAIFDDCAASGFLEGSTDALKYLSTKPGWSYSEK